MTIELVCLLFIATLSASLWIPFIVGVNITPTPHDAPNPFLVPPDPLRMPPWIARAYRAHQNLLEQAFPFSVVVILGSILHVSTRTTQIAAIAFVVLRVMHAVGMITGWARMPVRPTIFTAGYIAILVLVGQILAHVPWSAS